NPDAGPCPGSDDTPDQDPRPCHCLDRRRHQLPQRGPAVTIAPALLREYPAMNDAQRAVVAHTDGPLLVIAGPGSGKTFSLVLRALNLLLLGKVEPRELVLCTFTEKAAFELRDRISAAAAKVNYEGDLSELRASTIHSLCNRL